jgi:hypothetical protein
MKGCKPSPECPLADCCRRARPACVNCAWCTQRSRQMQVEIKCRTMPAQAALQILHFQNAREAAKRLPRLTAQPVSGRAAHTDLMAINYQLQLHLGLPGPSSRSSDFSGSRGRSSSTKANTAIPGRDGAHPAPATVRAVKRGPFSSMRRLAATRTGMSLSSNS